MQAPSLIEFSVKESNEDKQLIRHTLVRQLIDLAKQSCSPLTQRYAIEGLSRKEYSNQLETSPSLFCRTCKRCGYVESIERERILSICIG